MEFVKLSRKSEALQALVQNVCIVYGKLSVAVELHRTCSVYFANSPFPEKQYGARPSKTGEIADDAPGVLFRVDLADVYP